MALGYDIRRNVINNGDTAPLKAFLYDDNDNPYGPDDLLSVSFVIQTPDLTKNSFTGLIDPAGFGYYNYLTAQIGQHVAVATFTLSDGTFKSTRVDFEVIDPFAPPVSVLQQTIQELTWHKLEDCFDADDEGPWLRDMTLNYFNKDKIPTFINDALFDINQYNPPTALGITNFVLADGTATTDTPLLVQATLVRVIYHLIRSYTEQPNPVGANIAWQDRRDYLQRWQSVLQIEKDQFNTWVKLWKRQFLGLGSSKTLVSSKAGRLIPAPMRTWSVGRGFY